MSALANLIFSSPSLDGTRKESGNRTIMNNTCQLSSRLPNVRLLRQSNRSGDFKVTDLFREECLKPKSLMKAY